MIRILDNRDGSTSLRSLCFRVAQARCVELNDGEGWQRFVPISERAWARLLESGAAQECLRRRRGWSLAPRTAASVPDEYVIPT